MWQCDKCKREFLSTSVPRFTARDLETDPDIWLCVDCGIDFYNYLGKTEPKEEIEPFETHMPKYDCNGQPW